MANLMHRRSVLTDNDLFGKELTQVTGLPRQEMKILPKGVMVPNSLLKERLGIDQTTDLNENIRAIVGTGGWGALIFKGLSQPEGRSAILELFERKENLPQVEWVTVSAK